MTKVKSFVNQFPKGSQRQIGLGHKSFAIIRKEMWAISSGECLGNNSIFSLATQKKDITFKYA